MRFGAPKMEGEGLDESDSQSREGLCGCINSSYHGGSTCNNAKTGKSLCTYCASGHRQSEA